MQKTAVRGILWPFTGDNSMNRDYLQMNAPIVRMNTEANGLRVDCLVPAIPRAFNSG